MSCRRWRCILPAVCQEVCKGLPKRRVICGWSLTLHLDADQTSEQPGLHCSVFSGQTALHLCQQGVSGSEYVQTMTSTNTETILLTCVHQSAAFLQPVTRQSLLQVALASHAQSPLSCLADLQDVVKQPPSNALLDEQQVVDRRRETPDQARRPNTWLGGGRFSLKIEGGGYPRRRWGQGGHSRLEDVCREGGAKSSFRGRNSHQFLSGANDTAQVWYGLRASSPSLAEHAERPLDQSAS